MGLLDQAARDVDQADLVILAHVETIRDQKKPATATSVATMIGGAPVRAVATRLLKLRSQQLTERSLDYYGSHQLTQMGCELLLRELVNWSPSMREQRRRDTTLSRAAAESYRRH
jgi:aspartate 1-decarboxylase